MSVMESIVCYIEIDTSRQSIVRCRRTQTHIDAHRRTQTHTDTSVRLERADYGVTASLKDKENEKEKEKENEKENERERKQTRQRKRESLGLCQHTVFCTSVLFSTHELETPNLLIIMCACTFVSVSVSVCVCVCVCHEAHSIVH